MTGVKTTVVVDERVWREFKRFVSSRYGNLRSLSAAVEDAVKCFNTAGLLSELSSALGLEASTYPSSLEVKARRPRLGTSAGEAVRRMRDEREARISGLEQRREEVR